MILVVEAIGRRRCGRFVQRTAPLLASTRMAARAVIAPSPARSSLGAAGSNRRVPAAKGASAATSFSEAAARSSASELAETVLGVIDAVLR